MRTITVDPAIAALCPALKPEELEALEDSLLADGCLDPLKVWAEEGILLDGHNRHGICTREEIAFEVVELNFEDREDAVQWVLDNQLARRNLTPDQMRYLRAMKYHAGLRPVGRPKKPAEKLAQSEPISGSTAERVAAATGVSRETVKRDVEYARNVDAIAESAGKDVRDAILSGDIKLTRDQVAEAAAAGVSTVEEIEEIRDRKPERKPRSAPEVPDDEIAVEKVLRSVENCEGAMRKSRRVEGGVRGLGQRTPDFPRKRLVSALMALSSSTREYAEELSAGA